MKGFGNGGGGGGGGGGCGWWSGNGLPMDALSLPLKENFKKEVRVEMRGDVECSGSGSA